MPQPKLSKLELQILEALWSHGKASIREIQEAFPEPRPAYTTIQTTVYRLEGKNALRRVRKISNADIFEPLVARDVTRHKLLDEILSFFGGKAQPMMAQLAEAGEVDARRCPRVGKNDQEAGSETERRKKAGIEMILTLKAAAVWPLSMVLNLSGLLAQAPAPKFDVVSGGRRSLVSAADR